MQKKYVKLWRYPELHVSIFSNLSQPALLLVPGDGLFDATFEGPLWVVAQFVSGGGDVASPVALLEDVELVHVERLQTSSPFAKPCVEGTDTVEQPDGSLDVQHAASAHLLLEQVAESTGVVVVTIAQEVSLASNALCHSSKASFDEVADIDERDGLTLIADGEIYVLLDAVSHQKVVTLARTIDSRRTEDDVVQPFDGGETTFGLQLAAAVGRVGFGAIMLAERRVFTKGVAVFVVDVAHDAERRDKDETAAVVRAFVRCGKGASGEQHACQAEGALGVGTAEGGLVDGFGGTGSVDYMIKSSMLAHVVGKLLAQTFVVAKVEFDEVDTRIL